MSVPNHDSIYALDHNNVLDLPPHHMGRWNEHSLIKLQKVLGVRLERLHIEPLQEYHLDYVKKIAREQIVNHLDVHDYLAGLLEKSREKIKGFTIMAEYIKAGGDA